jgi:hypothetical protein
MDRCQACGEQRLIDAFMRRWRAASSGGPPAFTEEHPLCAECHAWLTGLIDEIRASRFGAAGLLGSPSHGDRALVFGDQCYLCRELLGPVASIVDCRRPQDGLIAWGAFLLCAACDTWLANMAMDGRSVRGTATRSIDGPYGLWPHPGLAGLQVTVAVVDVAARSAVRTVCNAMGVSVSGDLPIAGQGAPVLFFEPREREACPAWAWDAPVHWRGRVAMVAFSRQAPLLRAVSAGASDWLTIPTTPQQVTAALQRAAREWSRPIRIDRETGLPCAYPDAEDRPSLSIEPARGADRFELIWLLRRYSRGYDDLAISDDGRILLFPRVPASSLPAVAARLNRLLLGRGTLRSSEALEPAYPRLNAAG